MKQRKLTRRQMLRRVAAGAVTGPFLFSGLTGCSPSSEENFSGEEFGYPPPTDTHIERFDEWMKIYQSLRIPEESITLEYPKKVEIHYNLPKGRKWNLTMMTTMIGLKILDSEDARNAIRKISDKSLNQRHLDQYYYCDGVCEATGEDQRRLIIETKKDICCSTTCDKTVQPPRFDNVIDEYSSGNYYIEWNSKAQSYGLPGDFTQLNDHEQLIQMLLCSPFLASYPFTGEYSVGVPIPTPQGAYFDELEIEGVGKLGQTTVAKVISTKVKESGNPYFISNLYIDVETGIPIYCEQVIGSVMKLDLFRLEG